MRAKMFLSATAICRLWRNGHLDFELEDGRLVTPKRKTASLFIPHSMKRCTICLTVGLTLVAGYVLWRQYPVAQFTALANDGTVAAREPEPIDPLPLSVDLDEHKVALGRKLFFDTRLSRDNSVSCASCHILEKGGADQLTRSIGIGGQVGDMNAPSVFNVSYNFKQFWDGRAETLEDQIEGPIHNPKEMGSSWSQVMTKLKHVTEYQSSFAIAYQDGMNAQNIKDAIATFERSLITPNSKFDQYLRGDQNALSAAEKNGYLLFKDYGCISCHQGTNIGGNLFEKFGVMTTSNAVSSKSDLGRFNVTGLDADRNVFKVPSLRNVAYTAPYFHDGSAKTLEEAVNRMAVFQLARTLTPSENRDIVLFLRTLTGEFQTTAR